MQLPTNYKMGTGLAATIMGQQAGLEQEKMGLENLYKGMQMPGEILKGQEQAALLNDPTYLQQKTANTLIELGNQHDASQFQKALNDFGRFKIQLQSAAGDPQKTQQIVMNGLQQMNIDPNSDFGRFAMQNPEKAIDQLIQGTEASLARTGGAKQAGDMAKQQLVGEQHMDVAKYNKQAQIEAARISAGATAQYRDQAQLAGMLKDATNNVNNIQNNLAKMDSAEGKNALINQFMASGVPQAEAEAAVNSPEFKQQLQDQLRQARLEQEHLKKQSPYFKGFNFGTPAPASSGAPSLPAGVKVVSPS